jgi:hypothetical protein
MLPYAPGARLVIRDEEWLVRRVDPSSDGGHLLSCDGVTELVRGRAGNHIRAADSIFGSILATLDGDLVR